MDQNVIAISRHFDDEEAGNEAACFSESAKNGFTKQQADLCDDGVLNCVACPFRRGMIGEQSQVAVFESIIWHVIGPGSMPDGDITVQLFDEDADEPVWPGYYDGNDWIYVDGHIATPTRWAYMPTGPVST